MYTGYWIQDAGYSILDTEYRIQDTGYRIQDKNTWNVTRFRIQDSGVNHGSARMDLIYSRIIHMKFIVILKYNLG